MALTVCQRWAEKYAVLNPSTLMSEEGSTQFRCSLPTGQLVATWTMKKDRLSYSSGFLFGDDGLKKLSARDATALLDEAASAGDATNNNRRTNSRG